MNLQIATTLDRLYSLQFSRSVRLVISKEPLFYKILLIITKRFCSKNMLYFEKVWCTQSHRLIALEV